MSEDSQHVSFYLLRGLSREVRHWGAFTHKLKEHSDNLEVYPLELPGAGSLKDKTSPLQVHEYIKELRPQYFSYKKKDSCNILLGFSLGGMIAMDWLSRFPGDFGAMVLVNSSCRISPMLKRLLPGGAYRLIQSAFTPGILAKETILARLLCNLADTHTLASEWAEIRRNSPVSLNNTLRQLYAASNFSVPSGFEVPILNLCSLKDRLVSYSCSKDLTNKLGGTLILHETAGHDLTTDDPDWCAETITNWLTTL